MCDNFLRSSTEEIDLSGPLSLINVRDNIACAYQTGTARLQKKITCSKLSAGKNPNSTGTTPPPFPGINLGNLCRRK